MRNGCVHLIMDVSVTHAETPASAATHAGARAGAEGAAGDEETERTPAVPMVERLAAAGMAAALGLGMEPRADVGGLDAVGAAADAAGRRISVQVGDQVGS